MPGPQLTPELAQEIAGETSTVIGLNVLITDVAAVVIGSGDRSRVGSVHEASLTVLRTLEPAEHSAEQARALHGVRPGITQPIVIDGTAVGTVGITGAPRRVRQFGQMVRRQTEILLREASGVRSRLLREGALQDLVRDIAFFDADVVEPATIAARATELGLDPRLPRVAVVVELRGTPAGSPLLAVREAFGGPQDVVGEITASRFAVLHHARPDDEPVQRCERLVTEFRRRHGLDTRVGIGEPAADAPGLHLSYADAAAAVRLGTRPGVQVFPIGELRVEQLLEGTAHHVRDRFVTGRLGALPADATWPALRATAIAWAENGFNLVRTADALHIHRNTLLHRLARITELTGHPVRDARAGIPLYLACLATDLTRDP